MGSNTSKKVEKETKREEGVVGNIDQIDSSPLIDSSLRKVTIGSFTDVTSARRKAKYSDETLVKFEWRHNGEEIFISGSFNDWSKKIPLTHCADNNAYKTEIKLLPGKHVYKYVVDGQWRYDMSQESEDDGFGGLNNFVYIKGADQMSIDEGFPEDI